MSEGDVGRLLVASLHQGIADLLPTRLEFYESWFTPAGLRDGRIGLAQVTAALSFLRQEGDPFRLVTARAGEYAADWSIGDLSTVERALARAAPPAVRARLVMRRVRDLVRRTYRGSRAVIVWRRDRGLVDVRGSLFCGVRATAEQPMCVFYAAAIARLLDRFDLAADVASEGCRATGAERCLVAVALRSTSAAPAE
jgi:hypothetical protein